MPFTILPLVFLIAAVAASPVALPQGVTQAIAPSESPPPGCSGSFPTSFGVSVMNISTPDVARRDDAAASTTTTADDFSPTTTAAPNIVLVGCRSSSSLELTLSGGILTDEVGRTGYIAANYQFLFDNPPQAGAIYTAGWSICANGSLALGGSNIFYECLSGNHYNLYDMTIAPQCSPVTINALTLIECP